MNLRSSFLTFLLPVIALTFAPAAFDYDTAKGDYRSSLLRLHNQERKKRNKPRFRRHAALQRAASKYARVMKQNNHFSHTGPDGSTAHERIRAAGFRGNATGENIAQGQRSAKEVFRAWMRSPGHRRNIRRGFFDRIGFGKSGTYWVTNFGG
ncbi:MAG: CAP domain-containing protein [Verrucomicrobiales bacterium]|nr:CAP domain-containing protein [Verrucomicrobiales bacterium]